MEAVTTIYRAYLLRLWRGPGAGWRASLEDPNTGQRRGFATLTLLMEFLERQFDESAPAEMPPVTAGADED